MEIQADFDCGNIIVQELGGTRATLAIRSDTGADYFQWFYFRADGEAGERRNFTISNAAQASYPDAWEGYRVLASYDQQDWFRLPTSYDGAALNFEHETGQATAYYAFFVPYLADRRERLLDEAAQAPFVERRSIGNSHEGRPIELLVFGDEARKAQPVWVITRQHAGEPMAEWATEGLVRRLLDTSDAQAEALLGKATIYIVPNINPDGTTHGNLRANAAGVDLNRAWDKPEQARPEVSAVLAAMETSGVGFFLDMHGDEARPYIWLSHPSVELTAERQALQERIEEEFGRHNPELRPAPAFIDGSIQPGDLAMGVNYVAATYECPAVIVELPFKETGTLGAQPDSLLAEGCMRFGRSCVDVLNLFIE